MSFYVMVSYALGMICSFEMIRQFPQILKIIEDFEVFIEKSVYFSFKFQVALQADISLSLPLSLFL